MVLAFSSSLLSILWPISWLTMIDLTISTNKAQTHAFVVLFFKVFYNLKQRLHEWFFCKRGNISSTKFPKKILHQGIHHLKE
jgi:hypothetical protein